MCPYSVTLLLGFTGATKHISEDTKHFHRRFCRSVVRCDDDAQTERAMTLKKNLKTHLQSDYGLHTYSTSILSVNHSFFASEDFFFPKVI